MVILGKDWGFLIMRYLAFLLFFMSATPICAQMSYVDEARALGVVAGQGLACGSAKYDTFEMLARAIILTKSPNNELQDRALKIFTEEKANVFVSKQMDNFAECAKIVSAFDRQDIFKATLYGDGTIKMPDGQILTPRTPYDASMIYDRNSNVRQRANSIYNKDTSHLKKIEFRDASIASGYQVKPGGAKAGVQRILASPKRIKRK